ncbi:hypothetical protein JKY72_04685 [Candidatus Gracilibacteria bacterium]|nr:hypothetical protein [Candidatus Gracilibacteria bacterium]
MSEEGLAYVDALTSKPTLQRELGEVMRTIRDAGENEELSAKRDRIKAMIADCARVIKGRNGTAPKPKPQTEKEEDPDRSEWI